MGDKLPDHVLAGAAGGDPPPRRCDHQIVLLEDGDLADSIDQANPLTHHRQRTSKKHIYYLFLYIEDCIE